MRMFCMFPHVAASAWPIGHPYTRTWVCCDQELFWETEYFSLRITAEIPRKILTGGTKKSTLPIFKIVIATVNEIFRGSSSRLFQLLSPLVWTVFPGSSIKLCWSQSSDFPDKQSIMSAGKFIKYSLYCVNFFEQASNLVFASQYSVFDVLVHNWSCYLGKRDVFWVKISGALWLHTCAISARPN